MSNEKRLTAEKNSLGLMQIETYVFETKEMSHQEADNFEKWFDYHINTDIERNEDDDGMVSFVLFDIEEKEDYQKLKDVDLNNLEEKNRTVFKLNNLDTVYISKWMSYEDEENFREHASSLFGGENFDFRYCDSEYNIYKKLDNSTPADGAKEISFDELQVIKEELLSGQSKIKDENTFEQLISNIDWDNYCCETDEDDEEEAYWSIESVIYSQLEQISSTEDEDEDFVSDVTKNINLYFKATGQDKIINEDQSEEFLEYFDYIAQNEFVLHKDYQGTMISKEVSEMSVEERGAEFAKLVERTEVSDEVKLG